jgi:hypothetical protein
MQGVMDEVAIFDEALTEKEIQDIMNSPRGLAGLYLAVNPEDKAATTWSQIKTR